MATNVENTLKRANELVDVGQKGQALALLYELISNKKQHRRMWTKMHEDAMMLFVRLCVELRDNRGAREGLLSYRNIAQTQAPGSLEAVINYMLDLSDEKVEKALSQCKSKGDVSRIVDDLEEGGSSPEAMLLATVASEKDRARSEQAILVPWLKFSWENLRSVLETLRSNVAMEQTYHATAHRAFAFCKAYGRKLEFRRLVELLRTHLTNLLKPKDGDESPKLSPETMELQLGTRFEQLKVATALHLWMDGYKTIEDIHGIMSRSTKKPSVQLMATYYQKLTQMFLVAGSHLYHAFAYRMYYDISRERNKALTPEQIRTMASAVLLAAMSVPLPVSSSFSSSTATAQSDSGVKNKTMLQLLGFDQINPDRESLLRALRSSKVLDDCSQDVRDLYNALELQTSFDPQNLVKFCAPKIAALRSDDKLKPYAVSIERLLIIRLISQLGRVFQSVRLSDFHAMIDELGGCISRLEAEKLIVQAVRSRQVPLRLGSSDIKIDHASGTIRFSENVLEEQRTRDALSDLAKRLSVVCKDLKRGPFANASAVVPVSALSSVQIQSRLVKEQTQLLERKALIAQRRRELDDLAAFRTRQKEEREEAERRARMEREQARLLKQEQERRRQEEERRVRQQQEEEAAARLREAGIDLGSGVEELSIEERERLLKEKQAKQMQAHLEAEKKMQSRAKKLDAWVRATREAEKAALAKESERRKIRDREEFIAESARALQIAKERHAEGLVLKASFARIQPYRKAFEDMMKPVWNSHVEAAKKLWLQEREDRKRAEKFERALARREEDMRRRKREEEDARRREAEAQRMREEDEKERQRQAEARAALEAEQANAPGPERYKPRKDVEAVMADTYQGRARPQVRATPPPEQQVVAKTEGNAEPATPGIYRPKFMQNRS